MEIKLVPYVYAPLSQLIYLTILIAILQLVSVETHNSPSTITNIMLQICKAFAIHDAGIPKESSLVGMYRD